MRHISEQHIINNLKKWKKKGAFDILNDISEIFTLVQLMDTLGNANHAFIIVGNWIFDSNYEKLLPLTRESSDIICYTSVGEEQVVKFEIVFYYIIYPW